VNHSAITINILFKNLSRGKSHIKNNKIIGIHICKKKQGARMELPE
jgi:hypothetical protein